MTKIFSQRSINLQYYSFKNREEIASVNLTPESRTSIKFKANPELSTSCVNCKEMYCITLPIAKGVFDNLSVSQTLKLCPTDAIAPQENGKLAIDRQLCISCGLCLSQCPVQAIRSVKGEIDINYDYDSIEESTAPYSLQGVTSKPGERFQIVETKSMLDTIIMKIEYSQSPYRVLNQLVNKALQLSGIDNLLTRQGDVNLRMDAIGMYDDSYVLCEIEKITTLDAPRDILDDVAVFCSRHDIHKDKVLGMIVTSTMPNKRTEFWELLHDITQVTGLRIAVIPLSTLLIAVWNRKKIKVEDFFFNHQNMSARKATENILGRKVNLPTPCNLLEPIK